MTEERKNNNRNSKKSSEVVKAPLPRILMLHGYRQNETAFRERSGGLRKLIKNYAEFVFCEAPHLIPKNQENADLNTDDNQRGWWFSASDSSYDACQITDCQNGFNESLEYLDNVFKEKGPFDGIIAFSQGACLGSILCRIVENEKFQESLPNIKFKFAILIAGFKSGQTQHDVYYDKVNKISMPTLHIIGAGDKVIPQDMAMNLTNFFNNPQIFTHDGGHFIPANADSKASIIQFLNSLK